MTLRPSEPSVYCAMPLWRIEKSCYCIREFYHIVLMNAFFMLLNGISGYFSKVAKNSRRHQNSCEGCVRCLYDLWLKFVEISDWKETLQQTSICPKVFFQAFLKVLPSFIPRLFVLLQLILHSIMGIYLEKVLLFSSPNLSFTHSCLAGIACYVLYSSLQPCSKNYCIHHKSIV